MKPARSFASDNNAGVHPEVLQAVADANRGHAIGYGDDPYTKSVVQKFKQNFGSDIEVFFVFNGTAANCLGLKALTNSYHAIICGEARLATTSLQVSRLRRSSRAARLDGSPMAMVRTPSLNDSGTIL